MNDEENQLDAAEYDENGNPIDVITLYSRADKGYFPIVTFKISDTEYTNLIDDVFLPMIEDSDHTIIFNNFNGITYRGNDYAAPSLDIKTLATDYDTYYFNTADIDKIKVSKESW